MGIYNGAVALAFVVMLVLAVVVLVGWLRRKLGGSAKFTAKDAPDLFDKNGKLKMQP